MSPHLPAAVIPTGVARFFLACGLCTPGYAVEGPLFDLNSVHTDAHAALVRT